MAYERLTQNVKTYKKYPDDDERNGVYYDRLWDFEDIGLSPEETVQLQKENAQLRAELEQVKAKLNKAVEDIKKPSVCMCCTKHCEGDDDCIDNGYMDFEWRGLQPEQEEK